MKKKNDVIVTVIFVTMFFVGLCIMLYPIVSNWWNKVHQAKAVASYQESVSVMDVSKNDEIWEKARQYNERLNQVFDPFRNFTEVSGYYDTLDISGTGVMGYVSVPSIHIELPIYHGTSDSVLQIAAGHIQGSSLPIGGENTHSVISGHRGLPSAKLFSDLDKMVEGDLFTVNILNEVLTYEVDKISIILPNEIEHLAIRPEEDCITLMTCTPYGINSHRLLIRGKRVDTKVQRDVTVTSDAVQVDSMNVFPVIFVLLLGFLAVIWSITDKRGRNRMVNKGMIHELHR